MDKQYDLPPEMQKLYESKQKQRAEAKKYFLNLVNNPYRSAVQEPVFDPAIMRFNALHSYRFDYIKSNPSFYFKVFVTTIPLFIIYYSLSSKYKEKEKRYRSGIEKYEDRAYKNMF